MNESEFTAVIGGPGTGKTTLIHAIIEKNGGKWLIVDPTGAEPLWDNFPDIDIKNPREMISWKKGPRKCFFDDDTTLKALFSLMQKNIFVNASILFDDAATFAEANLDKPLKNICRLKRNKCIDIFSVCHGLTELPPAFFTFITKYIMFQTLDDPSRKKHNILNYDLLEPLKMEIDRVGQNNIHAFLMADQFGRIIQKGY